MNSVYLMYHNEINISKESILKEERFSLRRLTPIQKVSVEIVASLMHTDSLLYQKCFISEEMQIYFATKFGEIKSVMKTSSYILKNELPVSPSAFQSSVHNCAVGVVSIFHKLNMPHVVISCPTDPLSKALSLAYAKIQSGRSDIICILYAEESPNLQDFNATARLIIIGNKKFISKYNILNYKEINNDLSINN